MRKPTTIGSVHIHSGRIIDVSTERLRYGNGREYDLDFVRHPGAAAVVAVDDAGRVCLVRQYRHGITDFLWEIPAGKLDAGEAPQVCAVRELAEETACRRSAGPPLDGICRPPAYSRRSSTSSWRAISSLGLPCPTPTKSWKSNGFRWPMRLQWCCAASGTTARPRLRCGAHNISCKCDRLPRFDPCELT